MGIFNRIKSAVGVVATGKLPNPLAGEPKDRSRGALVRELNDWCLEERKFWKPVFDFMREEQRFAAGKQWPGELKDLTPDQRDYIGDMVQQMINRKTATLYAKNPTPEAVLRERLNFTLWDGNQQTIDACKALVAKVAPMVMAGHEAEQTGQPVPPPPAGMAEDLQQAQAILVDYAQGMQEKAMLEKISETGELLIKQQWDAQSPDILICAKQAVTQVITSRVAFAKVMYQRQAVPGPTGGMATETANTMQFQDRLASLQAQLKEIQDEEPGADDPLLAQSRMMQQTIREEIEDLQEQASGGGQAQPAPDEGVVIDWLSATSVIVDRRCKCLKEFIGAHRVAHELIMTVAECETKFGVNLRDSGARLYSEGEDGWRTQEANESTPSDQEGAKSKADKFRNAKVCVWHIEDKDSGLTYVICDGVKDFLTEPGENEPEVNRFWSIVALTFNAQVIETNDPVNDVTIYPRSDVRLMMPMQINVNKAGQEKRLHRAANRPGWVGDKTAFASTAGQSDLQKLANPRNGHDVLMLENMQGKKIEDVLQPIPKQEFDNNLYDNSADSQAMMLATGQQASDLGEQRPDEKATGQNIAAAARADSVGSNIDDLNFFFSMLAQMCWEMDIQEMPQAAVQALVGRGATWPELTRDQVAQSIFFRIEAGSMGRPNQQAELQKIQVLGPQILQMLTAMGKSPEPLLKLVIKAWDANIDLDQLLADAQVLPPPSDQNAAPKPPSLALQMNFKDAPPEIQEQIEKSFGYQPAPPESHLVNKVGHGAAVKAAHENAGGGQPEPKPAQNQ